jgi:uncharacterized spore protein YtfJ
MKFDELVTSARDMLSVRRVYAEPFEKDGVTVIPAACVAGGGGGGEGHDEKGGRGEGGGFGMGARPVGAYVVKAGEVRWVPAVDVNRLVTAASAVAVAYLFTRARVARAQAKAIAGDRR